MTWAGSIVCVHEKGTSRWRVLGGEGLGRGETGSRVEVRAKIMPEVWKGWERAVFG